MSVQLVTILAYSILLPLLASIIYYTRLSQSLKPIAWLFFAGFVSEVLSTLFRILFHHNLVILNSYIIFESIILLRFIQSFIWFRVRLFKILIASVGIFEIFSNPHSYNHFPILLEGALLITFILLIFYQISDGADIHRIEFYFLGLILAYFSVNMVYFTGRGFMADQYLEILDNVHIIFNSIFNLCSAFLIWKSCRSNSLLLG
jgi:hypothetical protein